MLTLAFGVVGLVVGVVYSSTIMDAINLVKDKVVSIKDKFTSK